MNDENELDQIADAVTVDGSIERIMREEGMEPLKYFGLHQWHDVK